MLSGFAPVTEEETPLPLSVKLGWGVGELAIAFYVGVTMAFFLFYLTDALAVSPVLAGAALLIPRLWDAVTDPIMGAISDRTRTRIGRRRPYLLVGSICFGVSFYFVLTPPSFEDEWMKVLYFTVMYALVSTAYTIYDVPYSSMAAEMCRSYRARTNLVGYKMIAARVGIIIAATISPLLFNSRETLQEGFALLGLVGGVFIIVTGLIAFFATAHAPSTESVVTSFSLRDELSAVIRNRPFANLFAVFLLQNLAIGASATTLIYFLTITMQLSSNLVGPLFAVTGVVALLATPGWVVVGGRLGKKVAYSRGLVVSMLAAIAIFFLPPSLAMLLFGIYVISGIADAGTQLMPNAMVPDTVEVDELRTGVRREGTVFGAWAFCRKTGMAGGAFLASIVLSLFGFTSGGAEQPASAEFGVRVAFSILPLVLWIGAWVRLRHYDLDEERFEQIRLQLAETGGND